MKPIKLEITGLNSYATTQVIDLERLTEKGLFGIFGSTGSGKTTILDALTLALYAEIPRKTKDFINYSSNSATIKLIFSVKLSSKNKTYMVERKFSRTKNGVSNSKAKLLDLSVRKIPRDEKEPISDIKIDKLADNVIEEVIADKKSEVDSKILEIVGIGYEDFIRSVVLPQGKFNQFLTLVGAQKRAMLERLFGLDIYGSKLKENIDQEAKKADVNLQLINAKLNSLTPYTKKDLDSEIEELKSIEKEISSLTETIERKKEDIKIHTKYEEAAEVLLSSLKEKNSHTTRLDEYRLRKLDLGLSIFSYNISRLVLNKENLEKEIKKDESFLSLKKQEYEIEEKKKNKITNNFSESEREYKSITKMVEKKSTLLSFIKDYSILNEKIEAHAKEKNVLKKKKEGLASKNSELIKKLDEINTSIMDINKNIEKFELELDKVTVNSLSAILRQSLKKGEACPVCGFKDHDLHSEKDEKDYEKAKSSIDSVKENLNVLKGEKEKNTSYLQEMKMSLVEVESNLKFIDEKLNSIESERKKFTEECGKLEAEIVSKTGENFISAQEYLDTVDRNIKSMTDRYERTKAELEASKYKSDKIMSEINEISRRISTNSGIYENVYEQLLEKIDSLIDNLNFDEYKHKIIPESLKRFDRDSVSLEDIEEIIEFSKSNFKNRDEIEEERREVDEFFSVSDKLISNVDNATENFMTVAELAESHRLSFMENNKKTGDINTSSDLYVDDSDKVVPVDESEGESYVWFTKKNYSEDFEGYIQVIYDKSKSRGNQKRDGLRSREILKERVTREAGIKSGKIEEIQRTLESLKIYKKEHREAKEYYDDIMLLKDLFKGNKFIEYIAKNQLSMIVYEASERLSRITNEKYALEIDDELNFYIRDFVSGGQLRNISSLSGGEMFIASLSLAVSLSSHIQLRNKSPLEFFFLDEGFGTLDSDLLETVIDSLEKLKSENLKIGLISHVDELKSRVPIKLVVNKDEAGSSHVKLELT